MGAPSKPAASIRRMLTQVARSKGETPEALFQRYARERLLFRLSRSDHANRFVLKGASLFYVWASEPHRPTKDIDLLGLGHLDTEMVADVFRTVCGIDGQQDGLDFDPGSVSAKEIREGTEYGGLRVGLWGTLTKARLRVQIDIGLGDAVVPPAQSIDYPTLLPELGLRPFRLRAYPKEAVVAEKAETIVKLGALNSRMKDYHDLNELSRSFSFKGSVLSTALAATFARRCTEIPEALPTGLSDVFAEDATKRSQWEAFLRRMDLPQRDLGEIIRATRDFLWPPLQAAAAGEEFIGVWTPGGPWGQPSDAQPTPSGPPSPPRSAARSRALELGAKPGRRSRQRQPLL